MAKGYVPDTTSEVVTFLLSSLFSLTVDSSGCLSGSFVVFFSVFLKYFSARIMKCNAVRVK